MDDAATPAAPVSGTPPATPAVTPAPAATPAAAVPTEMVTLSKEAHDQLARDAARASSNQRKADLYDRLHGKSGSHFKPQQPATPPTPDEQAAAGAAEDRKAEHGLLAIAADPAFREVLDADPTLRNLLTSNPLAVLPMLAADALDADDAIALVKDALSKRKPALATPATPAPATPAAPTIPPANPNPKDTPVNEGVEAARKNPNTEGAIAGMLKARLGSQTKK